MDYPERPMAEDLTAEDFTRFREWIQHHSGIYLEEQKMDSLRISLVARATRLHCATFEAYYDVLVSSEDEFRELLNLITINETSFFRFPAQFEALDSAVVPEIVEHKLPSQKTLRVWSAGCSTGEEPYSIAMSLLRSNIELDGVFPEVLGTDVATEALLKAKNGVYAERNLGHLPLETLERYFERLPNGRRVSSDVREVVDFRYHNLVKEPYPLSLLGNWDVIFCRNVTIYFRPESTRRVVRNFFDSLNPGGYLFIGHSETLTSISESFEVVEVGDVFLYRKPRPQRLFGGSDTISLAPKRVAERASEQNARGRRVPRADRSRREPRAAPAGRAQAPPSGPAPAAPDGESLLASAEERVYDLIARGQAAAALTAAEAVVAGSVPSATDHLALAFACAEVGNLDEAVQSAETALALDPLLASGRYILGVIYQRRGDHLRALDEFKRALYIDPDFVLAHFNLGNLYRSQGAAPSARREYENTLHSIAANPDGDWTRFLGGFSADLLAETCRRSLRDQQKAARSG